MEQNVFSTVAYYIQIGITVKAVLCVVKHFDTGSPGKVTWMCSARFLDFTEANSLSCQAAIRTNPVDHWEKTWNPLCL